MKLSFCLKEVPLLYNENNQCQIGILLISITQNRTLYSYYRVRYVSSILSTKTSLNGYNYECHVHSSMYHAEQRNRLLSMKVSSRSQLFLMGALIPCPLPRVSFSTIPDDRSACLHTSAPKYPITCLSLWRIL